MPFQNNLVFFAKRNCPHCTAFEPEFEEYCRRLEPHHSLFPDQLAQKVEYEGDTKRNLDIVKQCGVTSFPSLVIVVNGQPAYLPCFRNKEFRRWPVLMFVTFVVFHIGRHLQSFPDLERQVLARCFSPASFFWSQNVKSSPAPKPGCTCPPKTETEAHSAVNTTSCGDRLLSLNEILSHIKTVTSSASPLPPMPLSSSSARRDKLMLTPLHRLFQPHLTLQRPREKTCLKTLLHRLHTGECAPMSLFTVVNQKQIARDLQAELDRNFTVEQRKMPYYPTVRDLLLLGRCVAP
jgi:hypothetical protein